MRVLITGGFGFVGGRLAHHLHEAGHTVLLGARQAKTSPVWLPQAQVVQTQWQDAPALERVCQSVDVVVHAAGMNAQDCAADPLSALEINGVATARLVEAARQAGVRKFLYLSTAHVYASPMAGVITEDTCPRNLHPYATSHLAGENALLHAASTSKLEGIVLRLSNAFGAPMHRDVNCWTLLVNDLCRQAVTARRLTLRSNGGQHRDFIAMAEVTRVIGWMIENSGQAQGGVSNSIYNVGSGRSKTLLEMTQLIQTRCHQVLGFQPQFQPTEKHEHPSIKYKNQHLDRIDWQVRQDPVAEIDQLLLYCNQHFRNAEE
ncbi:MAG: SDR family oxidoreductase [Betaproteobacteria bacterium]|nr:SDR family oxidoreductase [Betaproteobacteria bacterium]